MFGSTKLEPMEILIQKFLVAVVIAVLFIWLATTTPWRRKKRDQEHWENWNKALDLLERKYGCRMFRIVNIRQHAGTGTKAYAIFKDTSDEEAVWIPNAWPSKGEYILSKGDYGYGSHHDENVYYVKQVLLRLSKNTYKGWKRHEKRLRKVETPRGRVLRV